MRLLLVNVNEPYEPEYGHFYHIVSIVFVYLNLTAAIHGLNGFAISILVLLALEFHQPFHIFVDGISISTSSSFTSSSFPEISLQPFHCPKYFKINFNAQKCRIALVEWSYSLDEEISVLSIRDGEEKQIEEQNSSQIFVDNILSLRTVYRNTPSNTRFFSYRKVFFALRSLVRLFNTFANLSVTRVFTLY